MWQEVEDLQNTGISLNQATLSPKILTANHSAKPHIIDSTAPKITPKQINKLNTINSKTWTNPTNPREGGTDTSKEKNYYE